MPARSKIIIIIIDSRCYSSGAITKLTMAMTLIKIFIDGPEVSLNGSPTVSPTTVAA